MAKRVVCSVAKSGPFKGTYFAQVWDDENLTPDGFPSLIGHASGWSFDCAVQMAKLDAGLIPMTPLGNATP